MKKFFLNGFKLKALSIPELLVVGGALGVISVVTLGVANKEITTQMMDTQRVLFNNEVAVALADMQADNKLAGNTKESFNETLKDYYDFQNITGNETEIAKSFAGTYTDEDGNEFSASKYENQAVSSSGVSFAYTYNTSYTPSGQFSQNSGEGKHNYIVKNEALSSIEGFYDINGAKGPNKIGKDVMFFSKIKKDCLNEDGTISNFIPNAYGNCPNDENKNEEDTLFAAANVCSLTDLNCKANGNFELDRKNCKCECRISCPIGQELNEQTCTCSCNKDRIKNMITDDNTYVDKDATENACACMPKVASAPQLCKDNGGFWNPDTCRCECASDANESIAAQYNGLAEVDPSDFCKAKCINFGNDLTAFKKIVKENAKKGGIKNTSSLNKIANATFPSDKLEDMCMKCAEPENGVEYYQNDGFCMLGCKKTANSGYNENYFEFASYDPEDPDNSCKWRCIRDEDKGITKLANDLNNNANYTKPIIKNDATKIANVTAVNNRWDLSNYKLAQDLYFYASFIGMGKTKSPFTLNGTQYTYYRRYGCKGCENIYKAFKDNNNDFAGFLKYIDPFDSNSVTYAFGWSNEKSADDYKLHYKPNYNTCTVEAEKFSYGTLPVNSITFNCDYIKKGTTSYRSICTGYEFTFTPVKNANGSSLIIPNPNTAITAPTGSGYGKQAMDDTKWKNNEIGVSIKYRSWHDPLALNISDDESKLDKYPVTEPTSVVNFPIEYENNAYKDVSVHWIKNQDFADKTQPAYQFIVNNLFKTSTTTTKSKANRHIGNMFSDQRAADGNRYATGFEQLQAQYDANHDNLISRDEMSGNNALYIWKARFAKSGQVYKPSYSANDFKPLTDFVLDINTYQDIATDEQGNAIQNENSSYSVHGYYRKLIELKAPNTKPSCEQGKTCVKYIGYIDDNFANKDILAFVKAKENGDEYRAEIWQKIENGGNVTGGTDSSANVYYYHLWKINGEPKNYPNELTPIVLKASKTENVTLPSQEGITEIKKENLPKVTNPEIIDTNAILYKDNNDKSKYYSVTESTLITKYTITERAEQVIEEAKETEEDASSQVTTFRQIQEVSEPVEVSSRPEKATEVDIKTAPSGINIPEGAKLYQEGNNYYVVTIQQSANEYTIGYESGDAAVPVDKYFFLDTANKWYKVVKAKVTDIVFQVTK